MVCVIEYTLTDIVVTVKYEYLLQETSRIENTYF